MTETIQQLKKLLAEAEISAALEKLLALTDNTDNHDGAIVLASRYNKLQKNRLLGLEVSDKEENAILLAILEFCDLLEDDASLAAASATATTPKVELDAAFNSLYRQAAEKGDAYAQNKLGLHYHYGTGIVKDEQAALTWFQKAAAQGYAKSLAWLGYYYEKGLGGLPQDLAEAFRYCREAAEKGDPVAQCKLGAKYHKGEGVAENRTEALKWFEKSAAQGDKHGISWLAFYKEKGYP